MLIKEQTAFFGGVQKIYRFDNNFGASVIKRPGSYGYDQDLWELAVIWFSGDNWHLDYDTPITGDVLGCLTWEEVEELLVRISELEAN